MAIGVKKLFDQGISGCIVTTNSRGDITPMYLSDFENNDGVIPPRLVDIDAEISKLSFKNLHYIQEEDYDELGTLISDPQKYDFKKILNW